MNMITYLKNRKARKTAREWLHQARHARNLREDIADPSVLQALDHAVEDLSNALSGSGDAETIFQACTPVAATVRKLYPARSLGWWRENLEIAIVAVAVAMAFRTYFIQPFKIPTGSMQPTLYGIHYKVQTTPGMMDRWPLNLLRWAVYGEWYQEFRAESSGMVIDAFVREGDASIVNIVIGDRVHRLPRSLAPEFRFGPGENIARGQVLVSGVRTLGDHIFVNRVRWNFSPPRRGDVSVFVTRGIPQIDQDTHYIKRMVGLPNESVGVSPPSLTINNHQVLEPEKIRQISMRANGYDGFKLAGAFNADNDYALNTEEDRLNLGQAEYAAFGDNTGNSLDSRYWGPVPQRNLVGPAFWVYWPFSARWGRIN